MCSFNVDASKSVEFAIKPSTQVMHNALNLEGFKQSRIYCEAKIFFFFVAKSWQILYKIKSIRL